MPTLSQLQAFVDGGFWDVESIGMPADVQTAVWLVMAMVAMSTANMIRVFPVMPVAPRSSGLLSVLVAPIQHGSPLHLAGNAFGLLFMSFVLGKEYPGFWLNAALITVASGGIYWMAGPSSGKVIGASDALFGLAAYYVALKAMSHGMDFIYYIGLVFLIFIVSTYKAFFPNNPSRLSHLIGVASGVAVAVYAA